MQSTPVLAQERTSLRAVCALTFMLLACSRTMLLIAGGASVPFWDQWGGENSVMGAFDSGALTISQLLSAHNEHRILWTRLLNLALYLLNGRQWDNQVEAIASSLIYSVALIVPVTVAASTLRRPFSIGFALIVVIAGALPFGWENTLIGFQSQFYINSLLSLLAIAVCSMSRLRIWHCTVATLLIIASLLAMANGVGTAFVCAGLLILRALAQPSSRLAAFSLAAIALLAGITGYALTPSIPYHASLGAQGLSELISAFLVTSSWPLPVGIGLPILVAPAALWLAFFGRTRFHAADLFFVGLLVLGMLNAFAIAHSRGHGLHEMTSRYADTVLPATLAACYFSLRLADSRSPVALAAGVALGALLTAGLTLQSVYELPKMRERAYFLRLSTINMSQFLGGADAAFIDKPHAHVPYPDPEHLGQVLRQQDQSGMLPTSVLGRLALTRAPLPNRSRCRVFASPRDNFHETHFACAATLGLPAGTVSVYTGPLSTASMWLRERADISLFPRPAELEARPTAASGGCALDGLNDQTTSGRSLTAVLEAPLRLTGWARTSRFGLNALRGSQLKVALVSRDHSYGFLAGFARTQRPDVAEVFKSSALWWSGYDVILATRGMAPGNYHVFVTAGAAPYCDTGHVIALSREALPFMSF